MTTMNQVSGRLCVEIERTSGSLPELATDSNLSGTVSVRLTIKAATSLPPSLSHMVFCQYMFWGDCDITTVQPLNRSTGSESFTFVLVVKTFENSTAQRVPSECSQL